MQFENFLDKVKIHHDRIQEPVCFWHYPTHYCWKTDKKRRKHFHKKQPISGAEWEYLKGDVKKEKHTSPPPAIKNQHQHDITNTNRKVPQKIIKIPI